MHRALRLRRPQGCGARVTDREHPADDWSAAPIQPPRRTPSLLRREPPAPPPSATTAGAWVLATLPATNLAALILVAVLGAPIDSTLVPLLGVNSAQLARGRSTP